MFRKIFKKKDESWTPFTPALTPGQNNAVRYGIIDIGGESADTLPSQVLEIKIRNAAEGDECHFDAIVLSPLNRIEGRININTASKEVLQALPGISDEKAGRIIAHRPYGLTYGIGDILEDPPMEPPILGNTEKEKSETFKEICNLITIKGDVYEILVIAQTFKKEKKTGEKRLRVVVER